MYPIPDNAVEITKLEVPGILVIMLWATSQIYDTVVFISSFFE